MVELKKLRLHLNNFINELIFENEGRTLNVIFNVSIASYSDLLAMMDRIAMIISREHPIQQVITIPLIQDKNILQ